MPTVAPLDLAAHCITAAFISDIPHFALADGTVHRLDYGHKQVEAHAGGLLCAVPNEARDRLLSGGEDGKAVSIASDGSSEVLAELGRKWVSAISAGPRNAAAFATGRTAHVRLPDGTMKSFDHARTAEAISFAPKGMRVAVARYNGVTMHFPAASGKPAELEWTGAHIGVTFSPDGNFVVTAMQENALHGWRLADGKHMRMTGYPAKVRSLSWSPKGKWLASSGAPAAIVWPFQSKDGPMGKAPVELGTRGDTMATAVQFHPTEEILAIGYGDGMVLAVRVADAKEVLLRRPRTGAISSMGWDRDGRRLAFGAETGECGVIDIAS